MADIKVYLLVALLVYTQQAHGQKVKSTSALCADSQVYLSCEPNEMIFITIVENKFCTACSDDVVLDPSVYSDCVSYYDEDVKRECNGKESCLIQVRAHNNYLGFYGGTCRFKSNQGLIEYVCLPKDNVPRYDICGQKTVLSFSEPAAKRGFIHSPNYPNYYGNRRNCQMALKVPKESRIVLYLINMNIEDLSKYTGNKNDFVRVTDSTMRSQDFYGSGGMRIAFNTSENLSLDFVSDFVTTTSLKSPKGFLFYFEVNAFPVTPMTSTTTTTTTTETTTTESTTITTEATTEEVVRASTNANAESVLSGVSFNYEKRGSDEFSSKPKDTNEKTTMLSIAVVGLVGLLVVLIVFIFLLIRRQIEKIKYKGAPTQETNECDDDRYTYYGVIVKWLHPLLGREQAPEKKSSKETETEDYPKLDNSNIYVSSPIVKIVNEAPVKAVESASIQTDAQQVADISILSGSDDYKNKSLNEIYEEIDVYLADTDDYSVPLNLEVTESTLNGSTLSTESHETSSARLWPTKN